MTTKTYTMEISVADSEAAAEQIDVEVRDIIERLTLNLAMRFGVVSLRILDGQPPEPASEQDVRDVHEIEVDERAAHQPLTQYDP